MGLSFAFSTILTLLTYVVSEQVPFHTCGDLNAVTSLHVTPCNASVIENWSTCVLMHGTDANIQAGFVSPFDSTSLLTDTYVTLDTIEVPTPYSGYAACYGSIVPGCPVEQGKPYIFNRNYSVQSEFPVGTTSLKLVIRDTETRSVAACAKIPIVIDPNPAYFYTD